jgi:hypothetical protein
MSGTWKRAQPASRCPLDGGVSPGFGQLHKQCIKLHWLLRSDFHKAANAERTFRLVLLKPWQLLRGRPLVIEMPGVPKTAKEALDRHLGRTPTVQLDHLARQ